MNSKERITRILNHQPVDRVGIYEQFWNDTYKKWIAEGKISKIEDLAERFDFDIMASGGINLMTDPVFEPKTIREDDDTVTFIDGNGATLRKNKNRDGVFEHVDFQIKCKEDWEKHVKPNLKPTLNRMAVKYYRETKEKAQREGKFLAFYSSNIFSYMTMLCGHEHLLYGMADDPTWILDMSETYSKLQCELQDMLFSKEGWPDCLWYTDDLGYKQAPFMSTAMFKELILPGYKRTFDHCHANNTPVVLHSCGFMEPFIESLIEIGLNCLQAMEVKAGMDVLKIHEKWGDKIALIGGIDARCLESNNKEEIINELDKKLSKLMTGYGYILHSDHSISNLVEYESFEYFMKLGNQIGTYYT